MQLNNKTTIEKFNILCEKYSEFIYHDFNYRYLNDGIKIVYKFSIDNKHHFCPILFFPFNKWFNKNNLPDDNELNVLIFQMGMIELISYWKATCCKKIIVKPYKLSLQQILFWKKLYYYGLGEFFYTNNIEVDIDNFLVIESTSTVTATKVNFPLSTLEMVPIGGGKDSIVALELIKEMQIKPIPLIMNPREASLRVAQIAGFDKNSIIFINRYIDKSLLELNNLGYLNGHTPFSAMLAFSGLIAGKLTKISNMALSNESSANEATIPNTKINHQYSKSFEFETEFRNYVHNNISNNFNYYSLLRPLSELQIAALFSNKNQYNLVFKSCNVGSKTDSWCGKCPKCLFTFIMLSPFIDVIELKNIFSYNLFCNEDLLEVFQKLCGINVNKPFECVGTIDEVNIALAYTVNQKYSESKPYLLNYYYQTANYNSYKNKDIKKELLAFDPNHYLSSESFEFIKNKIKCISSKI